MNKKIKSLSVFRKNLKPGSISTSNDEKEFIVSESHYEPVFGKLTSETQYSSDGMIEQIMRFEYDANGFLICEELLEGDGSVLEKKTFEADSDGRIARAFVHYADLSADRIEYTYDEKERLIKKESFDEDDVFGWSENFEYESDHLTRETKLDEDGGILADTFYTYDDNGNLIEALCDNQEEEIWYRKVYRYDDEGFRQSVTTYNREGDPVERVSFENDTQGRPTQIVEENRRQKNTVIMEYNQLGEIVFQEEKDLNGEVTNRLEKVYDQNGVLLESHILVRNFQRGISRNYLLRNEYTFFDE